MPHARLNKTLVNLGLRLRPTGNRWTRKVVDRGEVVFEGSAADVWQWLRDSRRIPAAREPSPRQKIARAMHHPDRYVCRVVYRSKDGTFTARLISPIRFTANDRCVLALCLGREETRQFLVSQICSLALVDANQVVMGEEPVIELDSTLDSTDDAGQASDRGKATADQS